MKYVIALVRVQQVVDVLVTKRVNINAQGTGGRRYLGASAVSRCRKNPRSPGKMM